MHQSISADFLSIGLNFAATAEETATHQRMRHSDQNLHIRGHSEWGGSRSLFMFQLGTLRNRGVCSLSRAMVPCGPRPRLRSLDAQVSAFSTVGILKNSINCKPYF